MPLLLFLSLLYAITRKNFIDLFYAIAKGDGKAAGRLMIERVCNMYYIYTYTLLLLLSILL
jgi:hypothetical protein